jgi:hypothetical protein
MGKMFQNASSLKPLGQLKPNCPGMIIGRSVCLSSATIVFEPEALKSLYRSPGYKKNQLVLCKNSKFVKDLPMIDERYRLLRASGSKTIVADDKQT